jgi:hypothetical protein
LELKVVCKSIRRKTQILPRRWKPNLKTLALRKTRLKLNSFTDQKANSLMFQSQPTLRKLKSRLKR